MELKKIKGLGESKLKLIEKLKITNSKELVEYYPFRYNIIKKTDINNINIDDKIIIDGIIETTPNVFYFSRKKDKMSFKLNTNDRLLNIVIFNRGFLKSKLKIGETITVIGKVEKNNIVASEIRMGKLPDKPLIEPVYHITNGIRLYTRLFK